MKNEQSVANLHSATQELKTYYDIQSNIPCNFLNFLKSNGYLYPDITKQTGIQLSIVRAWRELGKQPSFEEYEILEETFGLTKEGLVRNAGTDFVNAYNLTDFTRMANLEKIDALQRVDALLVDNEKIDVTRSFAIRVMDTTIDLEEMPCETFYVFTDNPSLLQEEKSWNLELLYEYSKKRFLIVWTRQMEDRILVGATKDKAKKRSMEEFLNKFQRYAVCTSVNVNYLKNNRYIQDETKFK